MEWLRRIGVGSNEQAVANARTATTELSRRRVEHDEVELYLRSQYTDLPTRISRVALDASPVEAAR